MFWGAWKTSPCKFEIVIPGNAPKFDPKSSGEVKSGVFTRVAVPRKSLLIKL